MTSNKKQIAMAILLLSIAVVHLLFGWHLFNGYGQRGPALLPADRFVQIFVSTTMLSVTCYASWAIIFISNKFLTRFVLFVAAMVVFPWLTFILKIAPYAGDPHYYVYTQLGSLFALVNLLVRAVGFEIINVNTASREIHDFAEAQKSRQFSVSNLLELTCYVGVTIALFLPWQQGILIDWTAYYWSFSFDALVGVVVGNLIAMLAVLAKRKAFLWMLLGASITQARDLIKGRGFGSDSTFINIVGFSYSLEMLVYLVMRIRGYHWTWRAPWKRGTKKSSIIEPPIVGLGSSANADTIIRDASPPIPPPLPTSHAGFQQIAEPPNVDSRMPLKK